MCKKISIVSEKGGVGKTTTTFNLAAALRKTGAKVLVVDLDKQCNLSATCGYVPDGGDTVCDMIYYTVAGRAYDVTAAIRHAACGIDYIPSSPMLDAINSQIASDPDSSYVIRRIFSSEAFENYDYILFDNKTAIDLLTQNALNASDYVIIPLESAIYSFDGVDRIIKKVRSLNATTNPKLKIMGLLHNKANQNTVGRAVAEAAEKLYNELVFKTKIPYRLSQTEKVIASLIACVDDKSNTLGNFFIQLANEVKERS